jgi:hypothetical protein
MMLEETKKKVVATPPTDQVTGSKQQNKVRPVNETRSKQK